MRAISEIRDLATFPCHLLNVGSPSDLSRSPFRGPLFEGFIASEIVKQQLNSGRRKEIYYFRDQQGLEVDLVVPTGNRGLTFIEAKASRTVTPGMAESLVRLGKAVHRYDVTNLVVHAGTEIGAASLTTLRPGVRAVSVDRLFPLLAPARRSRGGRAR